MVYNDATTFVLERVNYYEEVMASYDYRIGLGNGVTSLDLMKQIIISSKRGYVLYSAGTYFQEEYYNLLKSSYHFNNITDYNDQKQVMNAIKLDIVDKIENYYEIKNNCDYSYLISLLVQDNYMELKMELGNLQDKSMRDYLLESLNNIQK